MARKTESTSGPGPDEPSKLEQGQQKERKKKKPKSASAWKRTLKKACVELGTYKKPFDTTLEVAGELLARYDQARRQLEEEDGSLLVEYTNKGGETNTVAHPLLKVLSDSEKQILTYLNALGLTQNGLKRINEDALKGKRKSALSELLGE